MSKDYSFNVMPSVSISRSRFARNSQHKTTFNLGYLIPIYCDEVLPGDTRSLDIASLVRMSTPIAPIMDNIYLDIFAFFVPNRIVWDHWKEFMGENSVSAGIPSVSYSIPVLPNGISGVPGSKFDSGSYGDYFGLPVVNDLLTSSSGVKISALPFRGLARIYNRWFRDENVIAPLAVDTSDNNAVIVGGSSTFATSSSALLKVAKLPDYFTKALPYAQKGTAVSIPLGNLAPVYAKANATEGVTGSANIKTVNISTAAGSSTLVPLIPTNMSVSDTATSIFADLSSATAATINQLRYAFQLQKFLEKDALYGSRYWEILAAHFGVQSPDATLQDPEYLGGTRVNINIDQVLATASSYDSIGDVSSTLGQPGANSVTAHKGSLFTKSFVEHGHLIIVACARHDLTYTQGVNRMWSRQSRYDFYWPVFANLGAQEVKNKEIFANSNNSSNNGTFGYQEAWAEYRYKPSIATGLLRPGVSGNLGFWTLSENFASLPTLSQSFIEQDRGNLSRALTTGSSGPDFIADFYFRDVAVRPMPTYSIPGLIDHH